MVPTNAMARISQYWCVSAKPAPVAAINRQAASNIERREYRCAISPNARVSKADPSSVLVMIAPMANALKPSRRR